VQVKTAGFGTWEKDKNSFRVMQTDKDILFGWRNPPASPLDLSGPFADLLGRFFPGLLTDVATVL